MDKKGIESAPYAILISVMLILFAVAVFGSEINSMVSFRQEKDFYNSISDMIEKMSIIKSSSDYGSISRIELIIPKGYSLSINESDIISISKEDALVDEVNLKTKYINITGLNDISILGPGTHEIILQYGEFSEPANYSITFK